jgi:hypothetical protein
MAPFSHENVELYHISLDIMDFMITIISRMWRSISQIHPPCVIWEHRARARKNKSSKDTDTLTIGSILSAVINILKKRNCDPDMIVKLKKLRNHLVSIIEITRRTGYTSTDCTYSSISWRISRALTRYFRFSPSDAPSDINHCGHCKWTLQ